MSEAELIFTALAELSTRPAAAGRIHAGTRSGTEQRAGKKGGGPPRRAKKAPLELEGRTGQSVVTGKNYLPPKK